MADHKNTGHGFKKIKPRTFDEEFGDDDDKKHFPNFHLDSDMLKEVKDWENNVTYEVTLKLKQTSRRDEKDGRVFSDFDIIAIKSEGKALTGDQKKAMDDMGV